jgi:hypothetical protein
MAVIRRLVVGAVMVGFLAGPVHAQKEPEKTPLEIEADQKAKDAETVDKQYKSTLQKTNRGAVETRADPWSNMRGADDSKVKR